MATVKTILLLVLAAAGCVSEGEAPQDEPRAGAEAIDQRIQVGRADQALTACTAGKTKVKAIYGCASWSETTNALFGTSCSGGGWDYYIQNGSGAPTGYARFFVQRKTHCTGSVCDGYVSYARKQCSCNDSAPCTNY